jgi:general secretion pathway protein G
MDRHTTRAARAGFTLIELLVVIAIIGLLSSIMIPLIGDAIRNAEVAAVKADLEDMKMALTSYHSEFGVYPPSTDGPASGSQCLIIYLDGLPGNGGPSGEPFRKFTLDQTDGGSPPAWIDQWGTPIQYASPGVHSPSSYDLWSWGPNKMDDGGAGDDITNW